MGLFKKYIIESSTEIKSSPAKLWNFFYNLESNYMKWHPAEHHYFRWTKGNPLEVNSRFDSKEIVSGHKTRLRGVCIEAIENQKFSFKPSWPVSIMCTKLEWVFEPRGEVTTFIARTHYKFGRIFIRVKKGAAREIMDITKKHMDTEGVNIKTILEE
jgi:hypothetical protein